MKRPLLIGLVLLLAVTVGTVVAQDAPQQAQAAKPAPRVLTEVEQQQVVIILQGIQIWEAKRDHALSELARANDNAQRLVTRLCGEGSLNTQTMSCEATPTVR